MSSPIIQATITACILTASSNMAAQWITAYRNNTPYTIDWIPVLQFILYTALNCPPNFLWQQLLESSFPSHTTQPLPANTSPSQAQPRRLSLGNTLIKFALDQSLGASLNTLAFSLAMSGFRGRSLGAAWAAAADEFWPIMRAGWRLWPAVGLLNFTLVRSVQMRSLIGSLAGVGWSIYLSLVASGR